MDLLQTKDVLRWVYCLLATCVTFASVIARLWGCGQIFHGDSWGSGVYTLVVLECVLWICGLVRDPPLFAVCFDGFQNVDAGVFCRQLDQGYTDGIALYNADVVPGTGPIHLESVNCLGNESSIQECAHPGYGETMCTHASDVGVECSSPTVRLADKFSIPRGYVGRLEVFNDGGEFWWR
jgi:Scavenger receptor cysteine-rich domain